MNVTFSCIVCMQIHLSCLIKFQLLNVADTELSWVVKHLGHSLNVHNTHYRNLNGTIERAKVAKLLILADNGSVGQHVGKSSEELDFDGKFMIYLSCTQIMIYSISG